MRVARGNTKNKIYHVISRGFQKHRIFRSHKDYVKFISFIKESQKMFKIEIYAYCIMPNHFHFLIQGNKKGELSRFMHRICFRYAQYYNIKYGRTGKVWHDRYKSVFVDEIDYFNRLIEYIEQNPVRVRLVKRKEQWIYSSAGIEIDPSTDSEHDDEPNEKEKLYIQITEIHETIKKIPYYTSLAAEKIEIHPHPLL